MSQQQLLLVAGAALVVLVWVWRTGARRAKRTAEAARAGGRLLSLTGRVDAGAALLAGAQWLAVTYPGAHWSVRVLALGLPALFASYSLTRAFTVTTAGGGRR